MSRLFLSTIVALTMLPAVALAKTFAVPGNDPIATISIPDSWDPEAYEGGVEATSDDGDVYIAVEAVESSDIGEATREGIKWLAKQGIELDEKTRQVIETPVNGLPGLTVVWDGRDGEGPTRVGITLVKPNERNRFLLLYGWGSLEAREANAADIEKMIASLTATK